MCFVIGQEFCSLSLEHILIYFIPVSVQYKLWKQDILCRYIERGLLKTSAIVGVVIGCSSEM